MASKGNHVEADDAIDNAIDNLLQRQEDELQLLERELEENKEDDEAALPNGAAQGVNENAAGGQQNAAGGARPEGDANNGEDPDEKSVFVKNVDFSADEQSLIDHFKECGEVVRVTIRKEKHTQRPLGLAYIEFADKESSVKAKLLNESLFKGRQLTVMPKRKNQPGMGNTSRGGFGGAGRGNPADMFMKMMMMQMNGRGGGFRGRGGGRGGGHMGRGRGRGGPDAASGTQPTAASNAPQQNGAPNGEK